MSFTRDTQFSQALAWVQAGHQVALATVIETWGSSPRPVGAQMVMRDDGVFEGSVSGGCVEAAVIDKALIAIEKQECTIVEYGIEGDDVFEAGLACGGKIRILIEPVVNIANDDLILLAAAENSGKALAYEVSLQDFSRKISHVVQVDQGVFENKFILPIKAPLQLVIIGAVHIAQNLVRFASAVGFHITLIDNRKLFGGDERFKDIKIVEKWPAEALSEIEITDNTAIVTLTHDDKFDIPALEVALKSNAFYIGALGSRKTQGERNAKLEKLGLDTTRIHGPVGLNIGAKSPSEIAVSIMAEIIAEMRKHE